METVADVIANVADTISDIMDDLVEQHFESIKAMADMADLDDIIPAKKLPRPPKRIGPVNKANYTSNRPKRQARSSLHKKAR